MIGQRRTIQSFSHKLFKPKKIVDKSDEIVERRGGWMMEIKNEGKLFIYKSKTRQRLCRDKTEKATG
jgi:hypothetical protein